MYFQVYYLKDGKTEIVKESFIDKYKPPPKMQIHRYNVFWSPDDNDSPEKYTEKNGHPPPYEKVSRKCKNNNGLKAGYYTALLLNFAESEEELIKKLDSTRTRTPSKVIREQIDSVNEMSSTMSKNQTKKSEPNTANVLRILQMGESSSGSPTSLKPKTDVMRKALPRSAKGKSSILGKETGDDEHVDADFIPDSDDDGDASFKPNKKSLIMSDSDSDSHDDKAETNKNKNRKSAFDWGRFKKPIVPKLLSDSEGVEKKGDTVKEDNVETVEATRTPKTSDKGSKTRCNGMGERNEGTMNGRIDWSKDDTEIVDDDYAVSENCENCRVLKRRNEELSFENKKLKRELFPFLENGHNEIMDTLKDIIAKKIDVADPVKKALNFDEEFANVRMDLFKYPVDKKYVEPDGTIKLKENFIVTEEGWNMAIKNLDAGASGDSLFTKNVAALMWEEDKLCKSSVSGRKSNKFINIPNWNSPTEGKLTPEKLDIVRKMLRERIRSEGDLDAKELREKQANRYIGDKIATIRKSSVQYKEFCKNN